MVMVPSRPSDYAAVGKQTPYQTFPIALIPSPAPPTKYKASFDAKLLTPPGLEPPPSEKSSWKIVRFIHFVWSIIKALFTTPALPPPPDDDLYAYLLNEGVGTQVATSRLFKHIHQFLSKEGAAPADVLAQIKQTTEWLETVERINTPPPQQDPNKKKEEAEAELKAYELNQKQELEKFTESVRKQISALKDKESCVIPGGIGVHFALYRVAREGDKYLFQMISQDSALPFGEIVPVAGNRYMRTHTTFQDLTLAEVSNPLWLHALLGLQDQRFWKGQDPTPLVKLLEPFKSKQVDPASPHNQAIHRVKDVAGRVETVWNYVQDISGLQGLKGRRKLHFQIDTLFRYVEATRGQLKTSAVTQELVLKAIKGITQKMVMLSDSKELSAEETKYLTQELEKIQSKVVAATHAVQTTPTLKNRAIQPIEGIIPVRQPTPVQAVFAEQEAEKKEKERVDPAPYEACIKGVRAQQPFPAFTRDNLIPTLNGVVKELSGDPDPLHVQHELVRLCLALPFIPGRNAEREGLTHAYDDRYSSNRKDRWAANPDDIYTKLTQQERVEASRALVRVVQLLYEKVAATKTYLPDRLLAAYKVRDMLLHLAILNEPITRMGLDHIYCRHDRALYAYIGLYQRHDIRRSYRNVYRDELESTEQLINFQHYGYQQGATVYSAQQKIHGNNYSSHLDTIVKQRPDCEQLKDVQTLNSLIEKLYGKQEFNGESTIGRWSRFIEHPQLVAAVCLFQTQQGTSNVKYLEEWEKEPGGIRERPHAVCVQEAVMDNPVGVLEIIHDQFLKSPGNYGCISSGSENSPSHLKKQKLESLTKEQMSDFLLIMTRGSHFSNLLGFIEKYPELLQNADIRNALDFLFRDFVMLKRTMLYDLNLAAFMGEFFHRHITAHIKKGKITEALFLIRLCHVARNGCRLPELPDYTRQVHKWLLDSFNPDSQLKSLQYALLSEFLSGSTQKPSLNQEELRDFVVFYFYFANATPDQAHFDSVEQDRIRKLMGTLEPAIQEIVERHNPFLQHILDRIIQLKGFPLPSEPWKGQFPVFEAGKIKINLLTGAIQRGNDRNEKTALPLEVLNSVIFKKAFPNFAKVNPEIIRTRNATTTVFTFKDTQGRQVKIELTKGEVSLFREHPHKPGTWLFGVALPPELRSTFPDCIGSQPFFIELGDQKILYSFAENGSPLFKLTLDSRAQKLHFNSLEDLRPTGNARRGMVPQRLIPTEDLGFNALFGFEHIGRIILWTQDNTVKQIEISDLIFEWKNDLLTCIEGPFRGYTLNLNPSSSATQGFPAALVLNHPDPQKPTKILIPRFGGDFRVCQEEPAQVTPSLCSSFSMAMADDPAPLSQSLTWHQDEAGARDYWVFEQQEGVQLKPGQKVSRFWFEALLYSIASTQLSQSPSFVSAKRALEELRRQPAEAFEKEFEEMVRKLIPDSPSPEANSLALQGLLVLHSKCPPRYRKTISEKIAKKAMAHFSAGIHIDARAALSEEQITVCLTALREHQPEFAKDYSSLILSRNDTRVAIKGQKRNPFAARITLPSLEKPMAYVVSVLANASKETKADAADRNHLASQFKELYRVAKEGVAKKEELDKMRWTLKALPTQNYESDAQYILDFFELLFDLQSGPAPLALPPLPQLVYKEIDWSKMSYEDREKVGKDNKANDESYKKFLLDLQKTIIDAYQALQKETQSKRAAQAGAVQFEEKSKRAGLEFERKQKEPLSPVMGDASPTELMEISDLERLINSRRVPAPVPIYEPQDKDRLFTEESMKEYFVAVPAADAEVELKDERGLSREPVAKFFFSELQQEMKGYQEALNRGEVQLWKIKDAAQLQALKNTLDARCKSCTADSLAAKDRAMKLVNDGTPLLRMAGYRHVIVWEEMLDAFIKGKLKPFLRRQGQSEKIHGELTEKLTTYLLMETNRTHAQLCVDRLESMKKDGVALKPASGEIIREMLTRCRAYDPQKKPELIALEFVLRFRLKEDQIKTSSDFIMQPNSVRLASTGSGKTQGTTPCTGLMKPNGTNLVTLKFLEELYPENVTHIQKVFEALGRPVMPMLFSMRDPLIIRKKVNGKDVEESIFKDMYKRALNIIVNKGIVVTDKRSQAMLEAKAISLAYRLSILPPGKKPDPMDQEHLTQLSKLLMLIRTRQECVIDEYDKMLHPNEQFHLRLGETQQAPGFIGETALELFDLLVTIPELGLLRNMQAEGLDDQGRAKILHGVARQVAEKWKARNRRLDLDALTAYFQGDSEAVLKDLEFVCSNEEQDRIALTKNMLLSILPLTLSKTGNKKYIRSADGQNVIPARCTDTPREGSEFQDICARAAYMVADYFQQGLTEEYFNKWLAGLQAQAYEEIDKGRADSIERTAANRLFKSYFPRESLASLSPSDIKRIRAQVCRPEEGGPLQYAIIRKYLVILLAELQISNTRVSIDAHNLVSCSRVTAATSATSGCIDGLHRQFHRQGHSPEHLRAKMLTRFIRRVFNPILLEYDPASPREVIPRLLGADNQLRVIIDSAGALWGVRMERAAQQLQKSSDVKAVTYFDQGGRFRGTEGHEKIALAARGHIYSQAQSRGADVKLSAASRAVLAVMPTNVLRETMQAEGRLRQPDQEMRVAVPQGSAASVRTLLNQNLSAEAMEYSDLLYRSKMQELSDIVRRGMLDHLLPLYAEGEFEEGKAFFTKCMDHGFLITKQGTMLPEPGSYYDRHKHIDRRTSKPTDVLEGQRQAYCKLVDDPDFKLKQAHADLSQIEYTKEVVAKMPTHVYGHNRAEEGSVEVEVEQETVAEVEVSVETEELEYEHIADVARDFFTYLGWLEPHWPDNENKYDELFYKEKLNSCYDADLLFTTNAIPLDRDKWAGKHFKRGTHDPQQNRAHHVFVEAQRWGPGMKVVVGDLLDHDYRFFPEYSSDFFMTTRDHCVAYDLRLRRHFAQGPRPTVLDAENQAKLTRLLTQVRFEDGQVDGYTKEEMAAFGKWFSEQPLDKLKQLDVYFMKEVLKHRPRDRERYIHSNLKLLMTAVIADKEKQLAAVAP